MAEAAIILTIFDKVLNVLGLIKKGKVEKDKKIADKAKSQVKQVTDLEKRLKQALNDDPRYKPVSAEELKGKLLGG